MRRDFISFLDWPGHGTEGNHQFKGSPDTNRVVEKRI